MRHVAAPRDYNQLLTEVTHRMAKKKASKKKK